MVVVKKKKFVSGQNVANQAQITRVNTQKQSKSIRPELEQNLKRESEESRATITAEETKASDTANTVKQQQTEQLAAKQKAELEGIDLMKKNQKAKSVTQRNVEAGLASVGAVLSNVGVPDSGVTEEQVQGFAPRLALGAIGVAAGTSIKGISLSTLFSNAQESIDNLESDVKENVAESTRITRAAVTQGADVQQAIRSQELLEDSIKAKYNQAINDLRNSPRDVKKGLDFADSMSRDLRNVVENRQRLERYAITQDPTEILGVLGQGEMPVEEE